MPDSIQIPAPLMETNRVILDIRQNIRTLHHSINDKKGVIAQKEIELRDLEAQLRSSYEILEMWDAHKEMSNAR